MQQGTLTHAWTLAEAAMPQGWALMGLVRGRAGADDMDPVVKLDDGWYAWAVSADRLERVEGHGPYPIRRFWTSLSGCASAARTLTVERWAVEMFDLLEARLGLINKLLEREHGA